MAQRFATAVLIVGAVLIFLALVLNRDLAELSGKYKDASVTYRRYPPMPLGEVADALAGAVSPREGEADVDPAEELEELREEVQEIATAVRNAADVAAEEDAGMEDSRFRQWALWLAGSLESGHLRGPSPLPDYRLITASGEGERSRISTFFVWAQGWRIVSDVTNPSGSTFRRTIYGSQLAGVMNFNAFFPNDWRGAPDLEAGDYAFEWGRVGTWMGAPYTYPYGERLLRDVVTVTPEMLGEPAATTTLEPQRTRSPRMVQPWIGENPP